MSNIKLRNTYKSYTAIFVIGILVGCICRLLDYFPADTLWSFSSPQTLFGFWIITNTIIVMLSTSNICAGISSFLYMFGMTLSFLCFTSNIRNVYTYVFRRIPLWAIHIVYCLVNRLCNSSIYSVLLE